MSYSKSQYLSEVWKQVLDYLCSNRHLEPQIVNNFYATCELYELTEEKAFILAPNTVCKQIVQSQQHDKADGTLVDPAAFFIPVGQGCQDDILKQRLFQLIHDAAAERAETLSGQLRQ